MSGRSGPALGRAYRSRMEAAETVAPPVCFNSETWATNPLIGSVELTTIWPENDPLRAPTI